MRSFEYAGIATVVALLLSYPLAYWIAFRGGRWKNLFLLFIIGPVLRHVPDPDARLGDDPRRPGPGRPLCSATIGVLGADGRLLATSIAVIAGITYNFLPFMALPLYVSLEQIDARLLEAAKDLYASRREDVPPRHAPALRFPASSPARCSRSSRPRATSSTPSCSARRSQHMIGNVIQSKFLELTDYPSAAALSFILMAADPRAGRSSTRGRSARRS